ncbi:4262_t:CDS:2 [Paraglomus brasilianum]|uniref:4262_t:CDS:1 n=1 Tax=Paraglomus brasilianum TaxID=144538 RepID=A0A9N9B0B1_9GLOM|nr:4262_t:CDS:2 [Paraglomus brasilianum]
MASSNSHSPSTLTHIIIAILAIFFIFSNSAYSVPIPFIDSTTNSTDNNTTNSTSTTTPSPVTPITSPDLISNYRTMSFYAAAAYCKNLTTNWDCGLICSSTPGTQLISVIDGKAAESRAFVALNPDDKKIIVAFRGTLPQDFRTIAVDAQFLFGDYKPVPDAKVHAGFINAFEEIRDRLVNEVKKQLELNPGYSIDVSGHSLGGALAVLTGLDFVQNSDTLKFDKLSVYTLGQPRLGNDIFADYVDKTLAVNRFVHTVDSYTRLPPQFIGYRHHNGEIWIQDDATAESGGTKQCGGDENPNCVNSVKVSDLNFGAHHGPYFGVDMHTCNG